MRSEREPITRPHRRRTRAGRPSRSSVWTAVLVGLGLMPVVCGLTFGTLVVISEAALGPGLPKFDPHILEELAVDWGLLPAPPTAFAFAPPVRTAPPSPTFPPMETLTFALPLPPTAWPTATITDTPTMTLTPTTTATATSSASPTFTPSATATPSSTSTASATVTATRTASRTPTRTLPPTGTATMSATPSPSASATEASGPIPTTETAAAPTATDTPVTPTLVAACSSTGNTSYESTLLGLINQERANQGLTPYNLQGQLQAAARLHSTDMACNDFLSHTGSDGSTVRDRIERQGYAWSWAGENIYATGDTSANAPQNAFTWWMNSAPHRANLLSPNYTDIGLGYTYSGDSSYGGYFTAVFARP